MTDDTRRLEDEIRKRDCERPSGYQICRDNWPEDLDRWCGRCLANQAADRLEALSTPSPEPRMFPVVRGGQIPWAVAELAYIAYAERFGRDQSLERLAHRGGFHADELDELLPDWRDRIAPRSPAPREAESDEEFVPHPFRSRTPYEHGDDRDIWCGDCEYHRDHKIHKPAPREAVRVLSCGTCRHYNVDRMLGCCENIKAPCYNDPAPSDFGCVLHEEDAAATQEPTA